MSFFAIFRYPQMEVLGFCFSWLQIVTISTGVQIVPPLEIKFSVKLLNIQIKTQFFAKLFGHVKKKQYFCGRKSPKGSPVYILYGEKFNQINTIYGRLSP